MAALLQTKGMTLAAYRMSFRAMRSLWREPGSIMALAIGQFVVIVLTRGRIDGPSTVWSSLIYIAFSIVYTPYFIAVYRYCLKLEPLRIKKLLSQLVQVKYFIVYELGWQLILLLWGEALKTPSLPLMLSISVGAGGLLFWLRMRLVVLGPILAVPSLNVTAKEAFRATEGLVWDIFFIAFRAALPLFVIVFVVILLVFLAGGPLSDGNRSIQIALFQIFFVPLSVFGLVLRTVVEVQIFQRLGLPSHQHEAG